LYANICLTWVIILYRSLNRQKKDCVLLRHCLNLIQKSIVNQWLLSCSLN